MADLWPLLYLALVLPLPPFVQEADLDDDLRADEVQILERWDPAEEEPE